MVIQNSLNKFGTVKWIVDPVLGQGTHTTIQAAINSASSGDDIFIRTGTYTESPVLKAGVNLVAYESDSITSSVTILGTTSYSDAGTVGLTGINLQTNGGSAFSCTLANVCTVFFTNCKITATNATGLAFLNGNAASAIVFNSGVMIASAGFANYLHTGAGALQFVFSSMQTNVASAFSDCSSGSTEFANCAGGAILSTSGTGTVIAANCNFNLGATFMAHASTGSCTLRNCSISTGASTCMTVAVGSVIGLQGNNALLTSNASMISGAGQVNYSPPDSSSQTTEITATTRLPFSRKGIPSFNAFLSVTTAAVTGSGATATILFDTEVFDATSNYNPATGQFTAPVAGRYMFQANVNVGGVLATMTTGVFDFFVGAVATRRISTTSPGAIRSVGNIVGVSGACILSLAAAQTVSVRVTFSGGANAATINGDAAGLSSSFSGMMIT